MGSPGAHFGSKLGSTTVSLVSSHASLSSDVTFNKIVNMKLLYE